MTARHRPIPSIEQIEADIFAELKKRAPHHDASKLGGAIHGVAEAQHASWVQANEMVEPFAPSETERRALLDLLGIDPEAEVCHP